MVSNTVFSTLRTSSPDYYVKETSTSSRTSVKGLSRSSLLSVAILQGVRGMKGRKRKLTNGLTAVPKPLKCQHHPSFNVGRRGARFRKLRTRVRRRLPQRSGHRKGRRRNSRRSLRSLFLEPFRQPSSPTSSISWVGWRGVSPFIPLILDTLLSRYESSCGRLGYPYDPFSVPNNKHPVQPLYY